MRVLLKRPQTPTQIANEINKHQSHVSKTLTELEEMELIECLNPGAKKGRLYGLTDYGEEIFRKMIDEGYIDSD
ncbi:MAG TPA: ArsR family transcriptional regulator [Halococcus sp.]|nr:ArsR family transcriptional regulator [Halococcus sp.]